MPVVPLPTTRGAPLPMSQDDPRTTLPSVVAVPPTTTTGTGTVTETQGTVASAGVRPLMPETGTVSTGTGHPPLQGPGRTPLQPLALAPWIAGTLGYPTEGMPVGHTPQTPRLVLPPRTTEGRTPGPTGGSTGVVPLHQDPPPLPTARPLPTESWTLRRPLWRPQGTVVPTLGRPRRPGATQGMSTRSRVGGGTGAGAPPLVLCLALGSRGPGTGTGTGTTLRPTEAHPRPGRGLP